MSETSQQHNQCSEEIAPSCLIVLVDQQHNQPIHKVQKKNFQYIERYIIELLTINNMYNQFNTIYITCWFVSYCVPAAARLDEIVFDPSKAAFERQYFTMDNLGKQIAYKMMHKSSKNVQMAKVSTATK